jgi:GNAT superfamily N-acetyltransferase
VAPEALFAQDGIHKVGLSDLLDARDFPALIEEYARESALKDLPPPRVKIESYRAFEWSGALHVFVAAKGGQLVGFITVLAPVLPHYSVPIAVSESFFVAAAHRTGGFGLRLLAAAEEQAACSARPSSWCARRPAAVSTFSCRAAAMSRPTAST